eukprot:457511-Rhodomonas_salina.1
MQFGSTPDISWFRTFGCSSVVHQGHNLIEHGKLEQLSEHGMCVGLGLMFGRRCWLVYSARTNHVYTSLSCTSDKTLFPAKAIDQRVYGYYDNQPVHEFRADMHAAKLNSTLASDLPNLSSVPAPVWTSDDICVNEDALNSKLSGNMSGAQ